MKVASGGPNPASMKPSTELKSRFTASTPGTSPVRYAYAPSGLNAIVLVECSSLLSTEEVTVLNVGEAGLESTMEIGVGGTAALTLLVTNTCPYNGVNTRALTNASHG